jgi:riboflavin biosynthesis pyrimidine reductase
MPKPGYSVLHDITDISRTGTNVLVTSGPNLAASLFSSALIDKVILNVIPTKIGMGIKAFGTDPQLELESNKKMDQGRSLRTFRVKK